MRFKQKTTGYSLVNGFLNGFVEKKIDKPAHDLNGNCIVHYKGDHSMYKMMVKVENGKREGPALLLKGDTPYLKLKYENGKMTGSIERMDENRMINLRGQLIDGKESGIFQEFDGDKVVWTGYYRNGKRYSEVVKSQEMKGYYDERSVVDGEVYCISQYTDPLSDKSQPAENADPNQVTNPVVPQAQNDGSEIRKPLLEEKPSRKSTSVYSRIAYTDSLWTTTDYDAYRMKRNGTCFELEDGKVVRVCLYEKGQFQQVKIGFRGNTMTEYNSKNEVEYEGGFKGDMKNGYIRDGRGTEYVKRLKTTLEFVVNNTELITLIGTWKDGKKNGVFYEIEEYDYMRRECIYVNDKRSRICRVFSYYLMTEYDDNNMRRYDGCYKGNYEVGFIREGTGKEFGEDGFTPLYFGSFKNGLRDGEGEEYFGTIPKYIGHWRKGKKEGIGKELDWSGNMTNYGLWLEDEYQSDSVIIPMLAPDPEELRYLVVSDNSFNDSSMIVLKLNCFHHLKHVVIGNDSFRYVRFLDVNELQELESIVVGERSFSYLKDVPSIRKKEENDGGCRIINCPRLKSIYFSNYSFADYFSIQLESFPLLHSIHLGDYCFYHATKFSLTGLNGFVN